MHDTKLFKQNLIAACYLQNGNTNESTFITFRYLCGGGGVSRPKKKEEEDSFATASKVFLCPSYAKILIRFWTKGFCIRYEFISFTHITSCEFMFCYHTF